jgi:hypothetical protein
MCTVKLLVMWLVREFVFWVRGLLGKVMINGWVLINILHYNPRHVSSSTMLIFRRSNCIIAASGIVTL